MELKWQHSWYSLQALSNFYTIQLEFCWDLQPWDKLLCLLLYSRNVRLKRENRSKLKPLIFQCMYSSLEKAKDSFLSDFLNSLMFLLVQPGIVYSSSWFFSLVTAVTLGSILISFQVHSGVTIVVNLIFMRYNNIRKSKIDSYKLLKDN